MKWGLTLGIGLLALAGSAVTASAADMARPVYKAPPPPVPLAFNWTGCYVGGNVGWARADHSLSTSVPATSNMNPAAIATIVPAGLASLQGNGWTGGGQVGCNWQTGVPVFTGVLVLGVEGDFNFLSVKASRDTGNVLSSSGFTSRSIDNVAMPWFATLRGRVGVAFGNFLFFGTGGLAVTQINITKDFRWSFFDLCPIVAGLQDCHVGGTSGTRTGYTVGAGVEWAFVPAHPGWSVKAEYLFADFGNVTYTTFNQGLIFPQPPGPGPGSQPANHTVGSQLHVLRLGLNYLF